MFGRAGRGRRVQLEERAALRSVEERPRRRKELALTKDTGFKQKTNAVTKTKTMIAEMQAMQLQLFLYQRLCGSPPLVPEVASCALPPCRDVVTCGGCQEEFPSLLLRQSILAHEEPEWTLYLSILPLPLLPFPFISEVAGTSQQLLWRLQDPVYPSTWDGDLSPSRGLVLQV